jgi:hypothetical protein
MRSDELITAALRASFIPASHPEYTSAVVLQELNRTFPNVFADPIIKTRGGYWLKQYNTVTVANRARYRIPARALAGGLERIELGDASGNYYPLVEATPTEIPDAAGSSSSSAQQPQMYYVEGDQVVLLPMPAVAGMAIRMSYYLRPSRLVTSQSSTLGGDAVVRGQITSIANIAARQVTVNVLPFDQELAVPAALTTAVQRIDIVHAEGWHELALVGATQTIAGAVITIGGTDSLADVEAGDFVRVAEQTDWPCLPDEFHQTLADACGARFLQQMGALTKAAAMFAKVGIADERGSYPPGSDLARFISIIRTRVKTSPKRVQRSLNIIGGGPFPRFPRGAVS